MVAAMEPCALLVILWTITISTAIQLIFDLRITGLQNLIQTQWELEAQAQGHTGNQMPPPPPSILEGAQVTLWGHVPVEGLAAA